MLSCTESALRGRAPVVPLPLVKNSYQCTYKGQSAAHDAALLVELGHALIGLATIALRRAGPG